ncbi:MAG TPA: hypothetical protein VF278_11690 [Pirellulales bacterium]
MPLFCVSLLAGGMLSFQGTEAGDAFDAKVHIGVRAIPPSSSVPADGNRATIGPGTDDGSFAKCENDGPSLVSSRAKAIARALQLPRASLRRRMTSQLPPVLWAHTLGFSLLQRNVLLQI